MKKKYIINVDNNYESGYALLNFDTYYCNTSEELLNSESFKKVFNHYVKNLIKTDNDMIQKYIINNTNICDSILKVYKLLLIMDIDDIKTYQESYRYILEEPKHLNYFTEGLYNYWRKFSRFGIISKTSSQGVIDGANRFNDLVISTYRLITEKLINNKFNVYRQLPAGINACLETYIHDVHSSNVSRDIDIIKTVFIRPPYLASTKANKRSGIFEIINQDLSSQIIIKKDEWFMLPLFVGEDLAYFYFHNSYIHHAVGLCNLYKVASPKECVSSIPRLICYMGVDESICNSPCINKKDNQFIGYIPLNDKYDYFGYAKKMLLTLHNSLSIKEGKLPIHGAMARITFKDNQIANVILVGDSGAGKSELVEAISTNCKDKIKRIRIVYDDMGLIGLDENNNLYTSGTEIGAFVRLDDLDQGYAYEEIDRSIFLNPSMENARIIIPITPYEEVVRKYKIDLVLYANNYQDNKPNLVILNIDEAKKVFIEGKRSAKGTTDEQGISESFFANPFGPVQFEKETRVLIDKYFNLFSQEHISVGEIYTKLAIPNMIKEGPKQASLCLIDYLHNK